MVMFASECLKWRLRFPRRPERRFDGFDAKGSARLGKEICNDRRPCPILVTLYAKMGLHRYNFLEGKNYQFCRVEKYNHSLNFGARDYYITSVAMDPSDRLPQYFLIQIFEQARGALALKCCIAVPREDPQREDPVIGSYSVKNSDLQDKSNDWIRLYLELAVAADRWICSDDDDLSNLKIRKVAVESTQDPNEGLNAKNATFYISYKDPSKTRVGKHVDRIAKVRRSFDEKEGCLHLVGFNRRFKTKPKKASKSQKSVQLLFSIFKPWRLSSPRRRKVYRNRGVGFSRSLHKIR